MAYKDNEYIIAQDLSFVGVLHDIKKSKTALQPIFESFTNAVEAIKIKQKSLPDHKGEILIKINSTKTMFDTTEFKSLSITDNGIGFNEEEFKRFNTFKLTNKGYKNLGSGRLQYVHYFDLTNVKSTFIDEEKTFEREFIASKNGEFLKNNAIVKHKYCKEIPPSESGTTITFNTVLENKAIYNDLNADSLKQKLLNRYIHYFCHNKTRLPKITIEFYVHSKLERQATISSSDLPDIDKNQTISLNYSKKTNNGIEKTNNTERFEIDAFKIPSNILQENMLNLVSKGEVIEESGISLESLAGGDNIDGNKFLFLVSSDYIDSRDTNMRGVLKIPSKESFEKDLFANQEEIFLEEIQTEINSSIISMYPEIEEVKQKHFEGLAKLKEMFLLNDDTASDIYVSINDSESDILKKFYEAEAKKTATLDAEIKKSVDSIDKLDPSNENYQEELKTAANDLTKSIPLQNKKSLTHYVARRKLVLDLFQKILDNEKQKLNKGEAIDEDVLHNLIFQQSSTDPLSSDLWLINEEYIYFKGVSEGILGKIELDGEKIIKEKLTAEEEEYRIKQGGDAKLKRTDILLFPNEGKCIIIELKAPGVNVSTHLNQINRYASLINNLSIDTLKFNTFYGYLIGENIDADDIIDNDSDFINAPDLSYIFRPYKRIRGKFERLDGSLYTEIIKYSTILERAQKRNRIFIDKLRGH